MPNAFANNRRSPILRNRDLRKVPFSNQNRFEKLRGFNTNVQQRQKKKRNRKKNLTKVVKSRETEKRNLSKRRKVVEGPIPILRKDVTLQQQRVLPLSFRTLGILPTSVSIENPVPESRIRLDRTLESNVLTQKVLPQQNNNIGPSFPTQSNNARMNIPGESRFMNTPPMQQSQNQDRRGQHANVRNANFQGTTDNLFEPEWPLPVNRPEGLQSGFLEPDQNVFPTQLTVRRQSFGSFPSPRRPQLSPLNFFGSTLRRLPPIMPTVPLSLNYLPYLHYADNLRLAENFDIDTDNFLLPNSFPQRPHFSQFSQFMRTRFGTVPISPFSRGVIIPFPRRRNSLPFRSRSRSFPTSTPFQSRFRDIITTPPSIQSSSLVPPPSTFFFRDEDTSPFYQQPFYNPYYLDTFGTFLSDFNEPPRNITRSENPQIVRPFRKEKAERIKMSRSLGIHNLIEKEKLLKMNSFQERQKSSKDRKLKVKAMSYRKIIPF
ncbi:uncharacterized protein LOC127723519 [Mytilus californianus]|uniref:uncharacterized protein LOC127723519 n=1 Tax=Mytilus californianus TaxID=6549 RepID=UPI00224513D9|nr:uncharacterized protein LOC127723519 [Mytilus californianus]